MVFLSCRFSIGVSPNYTFIPILQAFRIFVLNAIRGIYGISYSILFLSIAQTKRTLSVTANQCFSTIQPKQIQYKEWRGKKSHQKFILRSQLDSSDNPFKSVYKSNPIWKVVRNKSFFTIFLFSSFFCDLLIVISYYFHHQWHYSTEYVTPNRQNTFVNGLFCIWTTT